MMILPEVQRISYTADCSDLTRKIVQVSGNIALCDDGTLWLFEVIDTSDESGKSTITNWKKIETPEDWG